MRSALSGALFGLCLVAAYLLPLLVILTLVELICGPSTGLFGILTLLWTGAFMGAFAVSG